MNTTHVGCQILYTHPTNKNTIKAKTGKANILGFFWLIASIIESNNGIVINKIHAGCHKSNNAPSKIYPTTTNNV